MPRLCIEELVVPPEPGEFRRRGVAIILLGLYFIGKYDRLQRLFLNKLSGGNALHRAPVPLSSLGRNLSVLWWRCTIM